MDSVKKLSASSSAASSEVAGGIAWPSSTLGAAATSAGASLGDPDPADQRRRPEERRGVEHDHDRDAEAGDQEAADGRAEEEGQALDRARRAVGGRELLGLCCTSLGIRAATAGRNGCGHDGGERGEHEDGDRRGVGPDQAGHREGRWRPWIRSVLTMISLRGRRSTRVEANGVTSVMRIRRTVPQMPTARDAAHLVGPDDDGRGVGPVADRRPGEGQVQPAQAGVGEHGGQRRPGLPDSVGDT